MFDSFFDFSNKKFCCSGLCIARIIYAVIIAAFMTAAALGEKVGVSESTVVRFASELGFKGYPEMQKELQQMIKTKLTTVQRMEVSQSLIGNNDIISTVLNDDINLIRQTAETVSKEAFDNAVKAINNAKKIYILGVRS